MRKYLRRITLFPFMLLVSIGIYVIGWLMDGHKETVELIINFLKDVWG